MKNSMKKAIALVLCALTVFALCACGGSDQMMSIKSYESKAKEFGLVIPVMQPIKPTGVDELSIVCKTSGSTVVWQTEYYILKNAESAEATFANIKDNFRQENGEGTEKTVNGATVYECVGNGKYQYAALYGKTILFADAPSAYESEVKDFIKTLGY